MLPRVSHHRSKSDLPCTVSKVAFETPDAWFELSNDRLGDPIAWGWLLACGSGSWTGQSPRRTRSLYYLSVVLSSHPYPAKSPWFLLPIGLLQHRHSRPRRRLVESASGLYYHQSRVILATRSHQITIWVFNGGQWVSGGYQMVLNLNKHRKCWIYRPGWCNAVAVVMRVCWWFWWV